MLRYVFKRILWFIPTLLTVTLIGFILLANAPGDPVNMLMSDIGGSIKTSDDIHTQKKYWRKKLGLDLPLFYFSMARLSEPDTLYKIDDDEKLKTYKAILNQTGNANTITHFFNALQQSKTAFHKAILAYRKNDTLACKKDEESIQSILISMDALGHQTVFYNQNYYLANIQSHKLKLPDSFKFVFDSLFLSAKELQHCKTPYKNYIPKLIWYGINNQYHHWLLGGSGSRGIIRGDFGISYVKKESVISILTDKLIWTLFFSLTSIVLAYLISIPIGIKFSEKPNHFLSKAMQIGLFMMYSLPPFFVGVLLLMLFANPDLLSIFPPSGIKPIDGYNDRASLLQKIAASLPYIILPLITYTYSSLAFISKITSMSINEQLSFDYIRTAKAKGLSDNQIIRKHALKNSLIPLITVFSSVFPSIVGGSVIVESIYTIPGMGLETLHAIISQDYPVVIAVVTISALLSILSYLLADILYAWVDPRIRMKS